jgi:hypothetical protein
VDASQPPYPYGPAPYSPSTGAIAPLAGGSSGVAAGPAGSNPQPTDPSKPLFTDPVDIGTTTANTTIVPPDGIVPVKYIVDLTFDGGTPFTLDVVTAPDGIGNVNLNSLEPCTTYSLSSVAVLPDGTTMEGGNFATLTTLTV